MRLFATGVGHSTVTPYITPYITPYSKTDLGLPPCALFAIINNPVWFSCMDMYVFISFFPPPPFLLPPSSPNSYEVAFFFFAFAFFLLLSLGFNSVIPALQTSAYWT